MTFALLALGGIIGALALAMSQRLIARPLNQITGLMTRLANNDHDFRVPSAERRDEIGALAKALLVFREMALQIREHSWVKSEIAALASRVQQATSHAQFGEILVSHLTPLIGAGIAVFYRLGDDGRLRCVASYGYRGRRELAPSYAIGEGLVGQCAHERKRIVLTELPADYLQIHSALGAALPRAVVLLPMMTPDALLGVIEFGALAPFAPMHQRLLDELMPLLALSLDNLSRALRTQQLLEETQTQAEELAASEESLRAQQEELRVQNEQLEQQGQKLRVSEEELRVQADELKVSNEEAQRASRYKSEFLANMSHELRTPLNSMLILSKSLADNEGGNLDAEQQEAAHIVHDSGNNLLRLINDVLDLSKVEAGKMDVYAEILDLADLTGTLERTFRPVARERQLEFRIVTAPELPATIEQDGAKLMQIVTNLLGNAFKFTHQGGVTLTLGRPDASEQVAGLDPARAIALRVADTGIGIPADKLARVFGAFEQADGATNRKYGGTGLGLSISRNLATLLGGDILLHSAAGAGATFTLVLPTTLAAAPRRAATPPAPVAAGAAAASAREAGKPLILIIEDDTAFAKIVADATRKRGCEAIVAHTGEAGIAAARAKAPTGIILDVGLPGMDGWAVMGALKADAATRQIPVHFLSATDESLRGLGMGAVGYLVKPVNKEAINQAFDKVLHFSAGAPRRLLLVDDDPGSRVAVHHLIDRPEVTIVDAVDGSQGLAALSRETFDCVILDLMLPDMDGLEFLKRASAAGPLPPVVIYSAKDLTEEETLKLRQYTDSIVIKSARSPERLIDEVTLFLHSIRDVHTPSAKIERHANPELTGKTALIVDDDMRNVFALSRALRMRGLNVVMAQDGYKALAQLEQNKSIDIVLMDIMMPGMDGYTTMGEIRKQPQWAHLPIIAVSAKAMRGDRAKCIEAGASDYLSKPIDIDQLTSMMRVLL